MKWGRYVEIQEVLGFEWCQRAVKTGLLLIDLGWMTKEEYNAYWKLNNWIYKAHKDDSGKTRLLAEVGE